MISVLYVDDEEFLLDIGKTFLERSNEFTVDICSSAAKAIDKLKSRTYDAVVSDYQMPGMDGIALLKEVRAGFGKLPFILFTGKGREEVVIKAIDNGVDFYVQKGGEPKSQFAELAHKIRRAVEQSQVLRALTLNEERMRLAIEGTDNGIWDINPRDRTFFINRRGCEMFGYTLEEIQELGLWWTDLVSEKDRADIDDAIAECVQGRAEQFRFEKQFRKKSGEWVWIHVRGSVAERDEQGNPIRFTGTNIDITDKKAIEHDLIQAKRDWETVFRAIRNPAFIVDDKQRIIDANQAVLSLTGTSIDEITLMNYHQFLIERVGVDRTDLYTTEKALEQEEKTMTLEIKASGRTYLISATPFFDDQGESLKKIFVATDITESKQMERALTESRDYLNQIFTSVREGILIIDAHTHQIIDANPAAIEMIGAEKEEVVGKVCYEYLCPAEKGRCPITDLHQSVDNSERTLITAGGSVIPIIKYVTPFNLQGRECLLETFFDNSKRKAAEEKLLASYEQISVAEEEIRAQYKDLADTQEALRRSEARFRDIVETSPDVIWEIDLDGRIQYVSPRVRDIHGYTPDEAMEMTIFSLVPQTSIERAYDEVNRMEEKGGGLTSIDVDALHRDGDVVHLTVRLLPLYDKERGLVGFRGVTTDVSDRKHAEEALKESENRFRQVAENAGEWIWELDEKGLYRYSNSVAKEIIGYTREELVGVKHYWELFPSTVDEDERKELHAQLQTHEPFRHINRELIHKDGRGVILKTSAIPYFTKDNDYLGYRGTSLDITEQIQNEEALQRVNRHLSLLSSITRHDILNLIMPIWGYVTLIEESCTHNADVGMYIEGIKSNIQEIQHQIEFTRIYQDLGVHEPAWQNLTDLLRNICPPEGVEMNISVENIEIRADQMFRKVFENFLDNSIRHGKDVSVISVSTESTEDGVTLAWEDDGGGIPDTEKEIIFERGYGKNSGLGLFLIRDILSLTEIKIKEKGKEGEGARFEMLIPRKGWRYVEEKADSAAHNP